MKISFYFRTKDEYGNVQSMVRETNSAVSKTHGWGQQEPTLFVESKHMGISGKKFNTKVPKSKPSNKKYIAIIRGNKHVLDKNGIDVYAMLDKLDIDIVSKMPSPPKYSGEQTKCKFNLTGLTQFRTLTSVFNKRFGHGNWRVNGPKYLQKVLKNYEDSGDKNILTSGVVANAPSFYKKKYPNGVEVTLIVNEPDANIEKHLFKVKLKV